MTDLVSGSAANDRVSRLPLALRLAFRDMRGGLRGFRIFLACIALGVMAIVGVGSVSSSLSDGVGRESRRILGGDISFAVMHRELSPDELSWLSGRGDVSSIATMRAMSRRPDGSSALVEIKAVDKAYPVIGDVDLDRKMTIDEALRANNGVYGVVAEQALFVKLDLKPGDRILIGDASFELRAMLLSEPDKLAGGIGFGPRVLMTQDALQASGLLQPGSLVRRIYRLALPMQAGASAGELDVQALRDAAAAKFPEAGWEIRTRSNVSPQFSKNLEHLTQFLILVGLTALVVGGVGVANAVRAFVERKQSDLGTLKALGATGAYAFRVALLQVMLVALLGICIGVLAGVAMPFLVGASLKSLLPFPLEPRVFPSQVATGVLYGMLTALAFSLLPLGRAHDVPVSALFRDRVDPDRAWPRPRYLAATAGAATLLIVVIVGLASQRRLVTFYVLGTLVAFAGLRLIGMLVMWLAKRAPHFRNLELRYAVANIHRPGALTTSVVLSLGLGLALLVALTMIDGNIRQQLGKTLPGQTPSFFFLDIQNSQMPAFDAFMREHAPTAKLEQVPMMRGRMARLNETRAEDIKAREEAAWVLEGDRGITYAAHVPDGSTLVHGEWWPADYRGPPLLSVEGEIAAGLGMKIGDEITINVFGRNITARVANLRKVNWRSLGINFVFVFSPNTFAGAPYTFLATASYPKGTDPAIELRLLKEVSNAFPAVTSVRVKDALDAINSIMEQLAFAIRAASSIALGASILVLAGALASGQQSRIYDAVILKTLGATRGRLLRALVTEYALLGLATAAFGILAGALAAMFVVTRIMRIDGFVWLWSSAGAAAALALVLTICLGLASTWRVLGQKPAPYLRNL